MVENDDAAALKITAAINVVITNIFTVLLMYLSVTIITVLQVQKFLYEC